MDILSALGLLTESPSDNNHRTIKLDSEFKNAFLQKIDVKKDSNPDFTNMLKVKIFNAIENQ
ncbi:hypothetical protein [Photobacterium leiognathi]|nr:hypothetical protein [Photobacterium leiognathi]